MSARLIVHLAPFLQGGAGRAVTTLALAQRQGGDEVIVATSLTAEPGFENYPEYLKALSAAGVELILVDSLFKREPSLNEAARVAIEAAIGVRRPMAIHAHAAIPARIGMSLGAPVIQTMHGWSRNKSAAHVAEDLSIMRDVDVIVFPSRASHDQLLAIGGHFRATTLIPYGIGEDMPTLTMPPSLSDLPDLRANGTKVLLTIGSLTVQKNHSILIEALPDIVRRHDCIAVLVGEGPQISVLRDRANALGVAGRVRFSGYVSDASSMLSIADLFVQPSLAESFGMAVVEAYRAGVPVVASHIPALMELVADTNCGWTFDAESPMALASAVDAALSAPQHDRDVMTSRARSLFREHFTNDRMIAGYEAAYRDLAS